jgi:hypothetical protein
MFAAPYILSHFNADREVSLLDLVKNSELRKELIINRDRILKENTKEK